MLYQIGDFSKISRLSIKTLRYYHECGLLAPTHVDNDSGYRYFDEKALERVRIINELKELDFSLKEIKEILENCSDDSELLDYMAAKSKEIVQKLEKYESMHKKLETFIIESKREGENKMISNNSELIIKDIPEILIASIRFKGRYEEVSKIFGKLFKYCGRYCCGAPFSLYYDSDYKEEDADIEACIPLKKAVEAEGITVRSLKGGRALTAIHKGPYDAIGNTYKVLFDYVNENNLKVQTPSREVYLKGPGLIIPRSPKKFITEAQLLLEPKA